MRTAEEIIKDIEENGYKNYKKYNWVRNITKKE